MQTLHEANHIQEFHTTLGYMMQHIEMLGYGLHRDNMILVSRKLDVHKYK